MMDISEEHHLLDLWRRNICPYCGSNIPEGTRVGSGRRSEGGFCSLSCYANYYALEIRERARRVLDVAKKHTNS